MRAFFLLLLAGWAVAAFPQKDLPSFGKIEKTDVEIQSCEFDKDAEAYKLLDYGEVHYERGSKALFKIRTEHLVRIKILKDKGLDQANVKLQYYSYSNYQNILDIAGITYNLDNTGNVVATKMEKAAIYRKPVNKQATELSFTLPEVKIGSVIEYKYTEHTEGIGNLPDWYFQGDIPVRESHYQITVPSILRFVHEVSAYQTVEQTSKGPFRESISTSGGIVNFTSEKKTYRMKNVPAIRTEPYMGAAKDYMQRVIFQLSHIDYGDGRVEEIRSTWPKLTKDLLEDEDYGMQLKKNIPHTQELDNQLKQTSGDYQKMVLVHNYVRNNMNWDGSERIYSYNGIKSAWDKKSGNNSEMNFILINLLRDAGLRAYPLLVSTKDHGLPNAYFPFLEQFNGTMTYVSIGEKTYVINAADKYNPAWLIPYNVVNGEAFVVDKDKGGWISLEDSKDKFENVVVVYSEIFPDGVMKGEATVNSAAYCKNSRVKKWKEERNSFEDHYFGKAFTGLKVENLDVQNDDNDTLPLQQKIKFSLPLNSSGDYQYFSLNMFQELETNPFVAEQRYTDIDFGYGQSFKVIGKIYIPEGYDFEELPKNLRMIMPDTSIVMTRMMQKDANSIDYRMTVDFKRPFYTAAEYMDFREFYKKMFATLNEQVVIKKKS